jgi:adenylosuccinate lyase
MAALEDVALWHERDISHSSVERIILPDSTILLDYLLDLMARVLEGMTVYPERMAENLGKSFGLIYSQRVLLKLAEKGLARQKAYEAVQRNAMRAWSERKPFAVLLAEDRAVMAHLSPEELKGCFDPGWYLRHVDAIYRRLGLL